MTDIRLNISWYTSLKRKALIRRLGHDGVTAIIDLWLYTAQHRPDGNLSGLSNEDITEAAQFSGDSDTFIQAIGPKPEGLGFLDGDSGSFKVHQWKDHNPWACGAKARSKAAKKAVEERWRKEREIRLEFEPYTDGIQAVGEPHIPLSSSSSDSPSKPIKNKTAKSADDSTEPSQPTAKSQELIRKLVATGKKFKPVKEPDILKQAAVIDLINRKGPEETRDFHPDKLADALLWAVQDEDFWRAQVKSCLGLRRRAKNGCFKYENILTAFERYQEKRFKTAWKSPEQRRKEAGEQRDIQAENERKRIQKEKQLKAEQQERDRQTVLDRKEQKAAAVKAKADEQERLKQFIPDADKFMKLWASKERYGLTSDAEIKTQIIGWMSGGIIAGPDLIKKVKAFKGESWIDFQKILVAPDGYDETLKDL